MLEEPAMATRLQRNSFRQTVAIHCEPQAGTLRLHLVHKGNNLTQDGQGL
jgi:hypothetical protein